MQVWMTGHGNAKKQAPKVSLSKIRGAPFNRSHVEGGALYGLFGSAHTKEENNEHFVAQNGRFGTRRLTPKSSGQGLCGSLLRFQKQ